LVLLLHGFPETPRAWAAQVEALGAAGWRAVAPTLRGFAPDALADGPAAYDQDSVRRDVFAMAHQLGAGEFHLVGHDLGGIAAWDIACRHPGRVRSLTAASTPHLAPFVDALEADGELRRPPFKLFRQPDVAEQLLLANDAAALRSGYAGLGDAAVEEYVAVFSSPGILTGALNHFRAFDFTDWAALGACTVPTLFLWGSDDPYLAASTARATRGHVEATFTEVEIEGVAHWVPDCC
jgi:pimeloyl-ACP methyl ester carboxylesterase